jgi:hypothetical protein
MSIDGLSQTSAAWEPRTQAPQPRSTAAVTVDLGMRFGDYMHVGGWASRKGSVPTQAPKQPDATADAGNLKPVTRPKAPVTFPSTSDVASTDGVSPSGMVTGRQRVITTNVQPATASALDSFNGVAWAGLAKANGKRDTTVLVPKGTDLSKPVEVIVHFHGNGGSAAGSTKEFARLIEKMPSKGRNVIFVIPTTPANKATWMSPAKGESLTKLQDEAVAKISEMTGRQIEVGSYTVQGFSGGGLPIATAARADDLRANHINLFDSSYGEWADDTVKAMAPGTTVNLFYTEHNRERASRLKGKPGVTVEASTTNHGGTPGTYFFR